MSKNMKNVSYKAKIGFSENDYIRILRSELKMAKKAMRDGDFFVGMYGDIQGDKIIAIEPDINEIGGFPRGYRLTPAEYEDVIRSQFYGEAVSYNNLVNMQLSGKNVTNAIDTVRSTHVYVGHVPDEEKVVIRRISDNEPEVVSLDEAREMKEKGLLKETEDDED